MLSVQPENTDMDVSNVMLYPDLVLRLCMSISLSLDFSFV